MWMPPFLEPEALVSLARRLRRTGTLARALDSVDRALEVIARDDRPPAGKGVSAIHVLRGALLLALDRREEAAQSLLAGRARLGDEPAAASFLVSYLLDSGAVTSDAREVFVAYVAASPPGGPTVDVEENVARLRALVRPPGDERRGLALLRRWNAAIGEARPDLAWPLVHLGAIEALEGNMPAAAARFRQAYARAPGDPKAQTLLAWALDRSGEQNAAREVLATDAPAHGRATVILQAHVLRRIGEPARAARWFAVADAARSLARDDLTGYAETLVNSGRATAAADILARVPPAEAVWSAFMSGRTPAAMGVLARAAARRLHTAYNAAGVRRFVTELSAALAMGLPPVAGQRPGQLHAQLLPVYVETCSRDLMLLGFHELADGEASVAAGCHRLALYYLAEAAHQAAAADWQGAMTAFERSYAHLTVALADPLYLDAWVRRRLAVYRTRGAPAPERLRAGVVDALESIVQTWTPASPGSPDGGCARKLAEAWLQARAELRAADALAAIDGFTLDAEPDQRIIAGPAYIALRGWEQPFAAFLLARKRRSSHGHVEQLKRLLAGDRSSVVLSPDIDAVRCWHSRLGVPVLLEQEGSLDEALARLRQVMGDPDPDWAEFCRRNPGFAFREGPQQLRAQAGRLEVSLLLRLGERAAAAAAPATEAAVGYWREALDASDAGRLDRTASRIRNAAIGRARVLDQHDCEAEAIALLEALDRLCGDAALRGALALVHTHLGIRLANGPPHDWKGSVVELRKAYCLNPHSGFIGRNLLVALWNRAGQTVRRDAVVARHLLREAVTVGEALLVRDPDDQELQALLARVREDLVLARVRAAMTNAEESA